MTPEMTAFQDDARCPRCGSGRLLRRVVRIERPALRDGVSLTLWWRTRRLRGTVAVERRVYHCEVCGWGWRVEEIVKTRARSEIAPY